MKKYINDKCPVCEKQFEDSDDIVVCPECGTPHHRACYKELGRCANYAKHKEGFEFESADYEEKTEYSSPQEEYEAMLRRRNKQEEKESEEELRCHICGEPVEKGATMCIHCGAVLGNSPLSENYSQYAEEKVESAEIEGQSLADIAVTIGANATRFIPKFIKNKKLSWNWSAFIFGPYYLLYRKMYRSGIIVMLVNMALNFVIQGIYAEKLAAFNELIQSGTYKDAMTGNPFQNSAVLTQLSQEPAYRAIVPMFMLILAVAVIIRFGCALFADSLYRQRIICIVKDVNGRLEKGDVFAPSPLFSTQENLNQKQMKALFLGKRGGVTIFAPIAAYFAFDLIMQFVSSI